MILKVPINDPFFEKTKTVEQGQQKIKSTPSWGPASQARTAREVRHLKKEAGARLY